MQSEREASELGGPYSSSGRRTVVAERSASVPTQKVRPEAVW
jgi:hypothetical protein